MKCAIIDVIMTQYAIPLRSRKNSVFKFIQWEENDMLKLILKIYNFALLIGKSSYSITLIIAQCIKGEKTKSAA